MHPQADKFADLADRTIGELMQMAYRYNANEDALFACCDDDNVESIKMRLMELIFNLKALRILLVSEHQESSPNSACTEGF